MLRKIGGAEKRCELNGGEGHRGGPPEDAGFRRMLRKSDNPGSVDLKKHGMKKETKSRRVD